MEKQEAKELFYTIRALLEAKRNKLLLEVKYIRITQDLLENNIDQILESDEKINNTILEIMEVLSQT